MLITSHSCSMQRRASFKRRRDHQQTMLGLAFSQMSSPNVKQMDYKGKLVLIIIYIHQIYCTNSLIQISYRKKHPRFYFVTPKTYAIQFFHVEFSMNHVGATQLLTATKDNPQQHLACKKYICPSKLSFSGRRKKITFFSSTDHLQGFYLSPHLSYQHFKFLGSSLICLPACFFPPMDQQFPGFHVVHQIRIISPGIFTSISWRRFELTSIDSS